MDLTPIIEIDNSNIYKDYNKFCDAVRYIIKEYNIRDKGKRFMIMPYYNGLPFCITIKHLDNSLKPMFYVSIFSDGVEIDITDKIYFYGITDDFINELIDDIKKRYGNMYEIILRGTIGIKYNINDYCLSKHITKDAYIMDYINHEQDKDSMFFLY